MTLQEFLDQCLGVLKKTMASNEVWQFVISLVILFAGFLLMELVWRFVNRRVGSILQERDCNHWIPYLSSFIPSLRLAFVALIFRIAEIPLLLPQDLLILLHGLESFLLALAFIFFFFQLVGILDLICQFLPCGIKEKFSDRILNNLKSILRIACIVAVAFFFVYTQKNFVPEWVWTSPWWRHLFYIILITVLYIVGKLLDSFLVTMTDNLREPEQKIRLRLILQAAIWPLRLILIALAIYGAKEILQLPLTGVQIAGKVVNVIGTLSVVIFLYGLLDVLEYELTKFINKNGTKFDQNFVQLIRMVTRVLVVVLGIIYVLQAITGKPMNALLAGLGIGGLAVALAAQDTLKNFFGSVMIMLDKPFHVGDRICVEGFDGFVEDIGFRSTRIRTFPGHLVSIPNEKMAGVSVQNIGMRPGIRRSTCITVTYDTPPDKVERGVNIIKGILDNHEGMHPDYPPRVYFNEFNDVSLNILVIYWYFPPDHWKYMEFSERVNFEIMKAFEEEGIEFAFPTMTTYLAQDDRRPLNIRISDSVKDKTVLESKN